jgi:hypothetical protein
MIVTLPTCARARERRELLLAPWLRCASRRNSDFATLDLAANLKQFPPNGP